jgi:hypothetical protein
MRYDWRWYFSLPMASQLRAIDRLKAAANLIPQKKVLVLSNGDEFELWHYPLTLAQRERAQKNASGSDAGAFALQLLIEVALDEYGNKLFTPGDVAELKHRVRDEDVQKLMLAVLSTSEDEDSPLDLKSPDTGTGKGLANDAGVQRSKGASNAAEAASS